NSPRFTIEVDGALGLAPLFGGDVVSSCSGACSAPIPLGAIAVAHAGYQLSSGLGLSLDGGYLNITQKVTGRTNAGTPTNLPVEPGTIDDSLRIAGALLGISGAYHRGENFPILLRVGAGVLIGSLTDLRTGSLTTTNTAKPTTQYQLAT